MGWQQTPFGVRWVEDGAAPYMLPDYAPPPAPAAPASVSSAAPADAPAGDPWLAPGTGDFLTLQGPDGTWRQVPASDYVEIDKLTRSGWYPVDPATQRPMRIADFQGGQVFIDPTTGQGQTLNQLLAGTLLP